MTSYRHPSPMDAWGFVPFLLDVPNSSYDSGRTHKKPAGSASYAVSDSQVLIFPFLDVQSSYNFVVPGSK